ncbi:fibronectin type III and SPRY domain-containing protein 1 [Anguilla anguilla]|uniref:fibronectin type III and SPRY domain-containing protein 1 n=1 Tax=Anguilla anguilla TaxID=7936 RepID=UPI0015B1FA50|nr:fibronectin type III and SPRY domain-containing protein 1 [Anguilla anguilla]
MRDATPSSSISTSLLYRLVGNQSTAAFGQTVKTPQFGDMDDQKDSLRKITNTLALKNEEIQNFICCLKQSLLNLEANSARVQEDLEAEFGSLYSALDELKEGMTTRIKQERASRTYELQNQLSACTKALESSEELLELANQTLCSSDADGFNQAAKEIKDSVTMAPAFRLSLKAKASDSMSHMMVDFAQEREVLQAIKFLPVPATPEIQVADCLVSDNTVTMVWSLPEPDSKIDHYVLEHRRTNHEGPPRAREEYPWMVVEGIRETEFTLTGLRFDTRFMTFRVKACNKAVAGEFSEPVTLETLAFVFKLDSGTSHQNLHVEDLSVEWDSSGGKVQDIRKDKNRTSSPMNSPARSAVMSPKRAPSARVGRDRFTAESYTVLGDTAIDGGQQYWEVRFDKESKAFAVGVALRTLGRFDQLGKTAASWCLHLNNWLQQSLTAKHNNKARPLDCAIPDRIGVYCSYEEGVLSFYNGRNKQLIHTFRTKFPQPVVPAFMVWNGSFSVQTGLQVPSVVQSGQRRNSDASSSNASLT